MGTPDVRWALKSNQCKGIAFSHTEIWTLCALSENEKIIEIAAHNTVFHLPLKLRHCNVLTQSTGFTGGRAGAKRKLDGCLAENRIP